MTASTSIGFGWVFFFLFFLPLLFSALLHYITSKNTDPRAYAEVYLPGDTGTTFSYINSFEKMQGHLWLHSADGKYSEKVHNSYSFVATLPVLGQQEIRIVKNKEETYFPAEDTKAHVVGYTIIGEGFEVMEYIHCSKEKNKANMHLAVDMTLFCKNQLQRSICRLLQPWLDKHVQEMLDSLKEIVFLK